jgi:hypothetical protein
MQDHEPFTLYRHDGTEVQVRNFYRSSNAKLADHLISEDGSVIYCQNEQEGIFWYKDTQEKLYRDNPM